MQFLAKTIYRRPWIVLLIAVLLTAGTVMYGSAVTNSMTNTPQDFENPNSESAHAERHLSEAAGSNPAAEVIVLVKGGPGEAKDVARKLRDDPAVGRVDIVGGGRYAKNSYAFASFEPQSDSGEAADRLRETFAGESGVLLGGEAIVAAEVGARMEQDIKRAELMAFPVLLVLLVIVFRGVVAAVLPLLVAALAISGSLAGLRLVAEFVPLSVFALNVVLGLGLGLAIDYSLLIVSRYREELDKSLSPEEAIRMTLNSAGRTVLVSALTVTAAMSALLLFPLRFLYSLGVGGILVSLLAAGIALIVLPALLSLLGERIGTFSLRRRSPRRPRHRGPVSSSNWYRFSRFVMRFPALLAVAATALLLLLAAPALDVRFTGLDPDVLPSESEARQMTESMERDFPGGDPAPIYLAVEASTGAGAGSELARYAEDLERLDHVRSVGRPGPIGEDLWRVDVRPEDEPLSPESRALVTDLRAMDAPHPVEVGGKTARFADQGEALVEHLPWALAMVVGSTIVLLFLATRSLLLPLKQLAMNVLTVAATFGVLVWIFQRGNLTGILRFDSPGALGITDPAVIVVLAFALSTDYGVFLLSRIREEREEGFDNEEAVARGVGHTGGIVTAAALLFCVAVGAFATSEIVFVKALGVGVALAVLLDATIVRALLVPSLMTLLGDANWWVPGPRRRRSGL